MLIQANREEADAILGAMRQVATENDRRPLSETGASALNAAARYVFRLNEDLRILALPSVTPADLAAILTTQDQRAAACRFLAVTPLLDGRLDAAKIEVFLRYADALAIREDYVGQLAESVRHLDWVLQDMTRQNIKSLWDEPWDGSDIMELLLPYRRNPNPDLAVRYDALGTLAPGTFGRQFWEIYKRNGYAFPGQEQGVNARFATPHDSTHVLSGYDTSPQGEILVSTFTAGMHPRLPMEGHILPVIFSWHLGIEINAFAKSARNQLDVEKFWVAWVRGSEMRTDLFAPDWDFWNLIEEPVAAVQSRYQVPGLAPRHAAGHHPLSIED
jgi:hypothetical protein